MQSDEQAIRAVIATWLEASSAGDLQTVLGLMTDDVVFLRPGQPPMRGKPAFAAAAAGQLDPALRPIATSEIQEIEVLGDTATIWTTLTVEMSPSPAAAPVKRRGNTLSILKKTNGQWQMYRDANMLSVVPE